jgi:hypothetical protein
MFHFVASNPGYATALSFLICVVLGLVVTLVETTWRKD